MFRKYFFLTFMVLVLWTSTALVASAQLGELHGHVTLKQADGKAVPAVGATIDVFRVDMTGKYEQKTDKKGEFRWAGLPLTGTYVIGVSMANASPTYADQVKVGRDVDYDLTLNPGDGRRLTFEELKTVIKGGGGAAGTGKKAGGESSEEKAEREKIEAKNRELIEKNKHAEDSNKILGEKFKLGNTALTAGQAASQARKFDEADKLYTDAITLYDEGITADPQHPGVSALLTNKAQAYVDRGIERYNSTVLSDAYKTAKGEDAQALLDRAKKDWKDAADAAAKAVAAYKALPATTDPAETANHERGKYFALMVRSSAMNKVVTKVDATQLDAGVAAYDEYLAAETDPVKKAKGERDMAKMLFDANSYEKAKAAYEKILAANPDDVEALQNIGLTLYNLGFIKEADGKKDEAKASYQAAATYLQQFVDKSPDGQMKAEAQDVLKNLKEQQNVQAEKVTAPPRRKRP